MNHRKTEAVVAELKAGAAVTLVREPDNKYDAFAVMVWVDGVHVGYIPKSHNKPLAAKIDAGGKKWSPPPVPGVAKDGVMAKDAALPVHMALDAKFVRSPNSGYPQVDI
ncbi:MAG: hypothetical protein A3E78_03255 [Alphaproteobacteria bacterium RIFCSPHIGHO2_12_FULL_63_12]|nr:MAG: hypothetical protein A3E78_03255 [Alphaproteobacteria bacterium RIFCSPHIGHO2_12_FULL_63_12]